MKQRGYKLVIDEWKETPADDMIEIDGKKYSKSTLKGAMKKYVE